MAGFLRKKTKQDPTTKIAAPPVTFSAPSSPPPLFARFATTAQATNNGISQRMVSAPIPLASSRKESFKGGSGRASTSSLNPGSRDAENARRKLQEQAQFPQASVNGVYYVSSPSAPQYQQSKPRPVSVDKPLPSPISYEPASPPVGRRPTAARSPGPPPVFTTNQASKGTRLRASMDMQDLQSKPLPRAGSVQARVRQEFNSQPHIVASPRHGSIPIPQITPNGRNGQQQQHPLTSSGQDFSGQSVPSHIPKSSRSVQHLAQDNANAIGGRFPPRTSPAGPQQTPAQDAQGTPLSDRAVDLPPEFALFQEFSETIPISDSPHHEHRPLPPSALKSTEQVPSSNGPRSSIYTENYRNALKPQPSLPKANSPIPSRASPPLPPPPPDMGVAASHPAGTDLLPSSYKEIHAPHVLSTNGRSSTYLNGSDVIHHQSQQYPTQAHNGSTSPPLPPGAALPANFTHFQRRNQDAVPVRTKPQPSIPLISPQRPPLADPRVQMGQSQSLPAQDILRKSPSIQSSSTPLRGKPKIFAAMEAQQLQLEPVPDIQSPPPQPSRPLYDQSQPRQDLPSSPVPATPPYLPPAQIHQFQYPQQHQQPHLLPSVKLEFKTPKSRMDPLPSHFPNTFAADLQPSSAYKPPASPPRPSIPVQLAAPQLESALHTPRSGNTRPLPRPDEPRQQLASPGSTPRTRKLSKPRHPDTPLSAHSQLNGSTTNVSSISDTHSKGSQHSRHRSSSKAAHPSTPNSLNKPQAVPDEPVAQVDEDTIRKAGIPLDDDPFARAEGVVMLKPTTSPLPPFLSDEGSLKQNRDKGSLKAVSSEIVVEEATSNNDAAQVAEVPKENATPTPLTPVSPEEYRQSRKERKGKERKAAKELAAEPAPVERIAQDSEPREPFTLVQFVSDPHLLSSLLAFLSFYDWCILSAVSREIRILLVRTTSLREVVLESYLKTVGYSRWQWKDPEPLSLSLQDLSDYMRGVSTPTHEYARVAAMHVHSLTIHPNNRDPSLAETVRNLTSSTRAYNRVLLRLRAQAEKESSTHSSSPNHSMPPSASSSATKVNASFSPGRGGTVSRVSSRAPSPTMSMYSHSQGNGHSPGAMQLASSQSGLTFRSPLFRIRRAPLLRVFVPSPEGDWLSDKSVLECEAECKRAGISQLLRQGDVVWDVAVGDEGNVGRLVWDGSYLIDLDYTYSAIGELPKYLPTLAFPPSYFHRVIRTGPSISNPVAHIDIAPWGEEIAMNLQLLQDRVRTETPQGAYHNVVRWVHRSSFTIKPPRGAPRHANSLRGQSSTTRIPIPNSNNLFVDPGWYGTIVVETEGTNEALADLQDRCGPGAFPPRHRGVNALVSQGQIENRKVFRILREKSRPGEIWMRTVDVKERLL